MVGDEPILIDLVLVGYKFHCKFVYQPVQSQLQYLDLRVLLWEAPNGIVPCFMLGL